VKQKQNVRAPHRTNLDSLSSHSLRNYGAPIKTRTNPHDIPSEQGWRSVPPPSRSWAWLRGACSVYSNSSEYPDTLRKPLSREYVYLQEFCKL
jgi:hypothetical protein